MRPDETKTLRYRLDPDTYGVVKYEVVPATKQWDSVSEFTKTSIQKQVQQLIDTASGGRQANRLLRRISSIDGIDEGVPETGTKPKIDGQTLDKSLSVDISVETFGLVNDLVDQTDLKRANVPGYCIFRHLSRGDIPRDELPNWFEAKAHLTWTELENSLVDPKLRLHNILAKRFRLHEMTPGFIQQDPSGFESFAEVYHNDLYATDHYDDLKQAFGSRTFNDVENTIEEYTDFEFENSKKDSGDTGFLEGCLEE